MKDKRNTLQKRIVSDIFFQMTNHPSAGMVYEEVHKKYPSISKATVYRILSEFAEEGTISRLKLAGASDRYDFNLREHSHVVCRMCGAVADVEVSEDISCLAEKSTPREGFALEGCSLEFVGVCKKCREA